MTFDYMDIQDTRVIEPDAQLSLNIQYSGYEDCTIFFDNATWDSGMLLEANILNINNTIWKNDYIEFDIVDSFGTKWDNVIQYFEISQGNYSYNYSEIEIAQGEPVVINGTIVETQRIRLSIDGSISNENPIEFTAKYTQRTLEENNGIKVTLFYQGQDSDDDGLISGFSCIILIISIGFAVYKKHRDV